MEKEIGAEVIKATQTSLGKYVKRPPLSDKLLRKPPFRFLHDIITAVLKSNGFFEGLFDDIELVSENVKDRDSKINFLQKVITVLSLATGKTIQAKPSKIVAGQEPEKTNELLQCLAYALDKKLSSDAAVKKFKENTKTPSNDTKTKDKEQITTKKTNDAKKLTSKSSEKLTANKKEPSKTEKSKTVDSKTKKKEIEPTKSEPQVKKTQSTKSVKKGNTESNVQTNTNVQKNEIDSNSIKDLEDNELKSIKEVFSPKKSIKHVIDDNVDNRIEHSEIKLEQTEEFKLNSSYTIIDNNELNSSLSSQELMGESNIPEENRGDDINSEFNEPQPKSEAIQEKRDVDSAVNQKSDSSDSLPSNTKSASVSISKNENSDTAMKPKELAKHYDGNSQQITSVSKPNVDIVRPPSVRPSSSRPGAPRLREKLDNIMSDNDNLLLAKVNIIAENSHNEEEEDSSVIIVEQNNDPDTAMEEQTNFQQSTNEHGHLVQQILDSQKEYSQSTGKTEIEWQLGAHKAMDTINQEIEQLRFNIQAMSRIANPLGKLLDHIQEDVEMMRQELQQWTNVYEEVSKDMVKQKTASEETLVPLQSRLKQLNLDIEEKRDKINDLKVLIHKNSSRIEKLLASGNVQ